MGAMAFVLVGTAQIAYTITNLLFLGSSIVGPQVLLNTLAAACAFAAAFSWPSPSEGIHRPMVLRAALVAGALVKIVDFATSFSGASASFYFFGFIFVVAGALAVGLAGGLGLGFEPPNATVAATFRAGAAAGALGSLLYFVQGTAGQGPPLFLLGSLAAAGGWLLLAAPAAVATAKAAPA
jgi:hypothetical protein